MAVQFLGDLSLDGLYTDPQHHQGLSDNMKWVNSLTDVDYRVINWESQLWGDGIVNELKFPRLCTTKSAAKAILPLNINLALLANNHVFDNQIEGFKNTVSFFKENNIDYIGAKIIDSSNKTHKIISKNGISVAFLNYVGLETNPNLPNDCPIEVNIINSEKIKQDIDELVGSADHIVVSLHWGADEYVRVPNSNQKKMARNIIDWGASAVIGHHVHCLQGFEEYNGGLICYSIGNFLFSPQLTMPGYIDSYRTKESNLATLLNISFRKRDFKYSWEYLYKERNSLLLKKADNHIVKYHNGLNNILLGDDKKLDRKYQNEKIIAPIRNFVDKNGGVLKAILSIRAKQILLFKKLLN